MQQRMGEERREFQRLGLDPPLPATFADAAVTLVDIGVLGARIHHENPIESPRAELHFSHDGHEIAMRCEVVRTVPNEQAKYPGSGMESGLRFRSAIGESGDRLRAMLGQLVVKAIEKRNDPAATRLHLRHVDGDKTVRGADAQFVCYRFDDGSWIRRRVFLPEQPASGFTVARGEDEEEMRALCEVYEASDDEGRRLIRLFAELSVSEALQIPPRK